MDKTRFIKMIERQPPYLFLIRPSRFGKSLFLAMLETYYSIDYAEEFEELFGKVYIGQHPTEEHNKYLVLRFNFSEVKACPEEVEQSFNDYCNLTMTKFIRHYEPVLGPDIWKDIHPNMSSGLLLSSIA